MEEITRGKSYLFHSKSGQEIQFEFHDELVIVKTQKPGSELTVSVGTALVALQAVDTRLPGGV